VTTIIDNKLQISKIAPVVERVLADFSRAAPEALEAERGLSFKARHPSMYSGLGPVPGAWNAKGLGFRLLRSERRNQRQRQR
jgi:hypothetical protein